MDEGKKMEKTLDGDDHHVQIEMSPTMVEERDSSSVCEEQRSDDGKKHDPSSRARGVLGLAPSRGSKPKPTAASATVEAANNMIKHAEPIVKESVQQVKKKCSWGGNLIEEIKSHKGDVVAFTNHRLQVHGLKEAFDGTNGWSRTFFYLFIWAAWGCFFLVLTVPLVQDFRARKVLTKFESYSGLAFDGLPLPILTVCPHGSGIRCDCLLWRKLHCRYEAMGQYSWMRRFDLLTCWPEFRSANRTDMNYPFPVWKNPQCEDFENPNVTLLDPCSASALEPEEYNVDKLFETIVARESSDQGPYLTFLERRMYASIPLVEKVDFFRTTEKIFVRMKSDFVIPRYDERIRNQFCVQIRVPPEDTQYKQKVLGASNGILVVAHDIQEEEYPLMDMYTAKRAVDIHINIWDGTATDEGFRETAIITQRHKYFVAAAGKQSQVSYKHEHYRRYQGWGAVESQTCTKRQAPRGLCAQEVVLRRASKVCGCPSIEFCSSSEGSSQYACVERYLQSLTGEDEATVDLHTCPIRCEYSEPVIASTSVADTTEAQILYLKNIISQPVNYLVNEDPPIEKYASATRENTILWNIGLSTLLVQSYEESPVTSLAGLMGTIGGNLGLWMGLSFSLFAEILEMAIVALIFGRPTELVRQWFQARRRRSRRQSTGGV